MTSSAVDADPDAGVQADATLPTCFDWQTEPTPEGQTGPTPAGQTGPTPPAQTEPRKTTAL